MNRSGRPSNDASLSFAGLNAWHAWLTSVLELPLSADYRDANHSFFVLVHRIYFPEAEQDVADGLTCDVRQENRPMIVPLHGLHLEPGHPGEEELRAYREWLRERQER